MPTVYCYLVKLTIADLIRAKSICSQTQFSHIINRLLTSLVKLIIDLACQPYNKPIIASIIDLGLYCAISDFCFLHRPRSFVARSILKNLGLIFHSTDLTLGQSAFNLAFL